jgi:hypothetical protein
VAAYCFFEPREILKFCFYVFDQDKTGFFSVDVSIMYIHIQ